MRYAHQYPCGGLGDCSLGNREGFVIHHPGRVQVKQTLPGLPPGFLRRREALRKPFEVDPIP